VRKSRFVVSLALVTLVASACSSAASPTPPPLPATGTPASATSGATVTPASASAEVTYAIPPSSFTMTMIVKIAGLDWYSQMESGLKVVGAATGLNVSQTGPTQATAEAQVTIIQGLIPTKPTVIGINPNNEDALEGVLKNAQDAGIKIIGTEGPDLTNANLDLEAMDNKAYGAEMMDSLATCMGGQGTYAAFVGHLTAASHMQWVASALQQAQAKYPGITRVSDPIESQEDGNIAYQKTKELLQKYPDLKGIEGSGATDVQGAARAVEEAGLGGKICIVGTSLPSLVTQYVKDGTIYRIFCWDPKLSGEALAEGAIFLAEGGTPYTGMNLHVPGYENLQPCGAPFAASCFEGNGPLSIGKENIDQYKF